MLQDGVRRFFTERWVPRAAEWREAGRMGPDAWREAGAQGKLGVDRAALLKYWVSEQQRKVVGECLQLFGGYGYMNEYAIAQLYADARVQRIYGGTSEIMKELASRFM